MSGWDEFAWVAKKLAVPLAIEMALAGFGWGIGETRKHDYNLADGINQEVFDASAKLGHQSKGQKEHTVDPVVDTSNPAALRSDVQLLNTLRAPTPETLTLKASLEKAAKGNAVPELAKQVQDALIAGTNQDFHTIQMAGQALNFHTQVNERFLEKGRFDALTPENLQEANNVLNLSAFKEKLVTPGERSLKTALESAVQGKTPSDLEQILQRAEDDSSEVYKQTRALNNREDTLGKVAGVAQVVSFLGAETFKNAGLLIGDALGKMRDEEKASKQERTGAYYGPNNYHRI